MSSRFKEAAVGIHPGLGLEQSQRAPLSTLLAQKEPIGSPETRHGMSVVLSTFPTTITRRDFASGSIDETVAKFLTVFNYNYLNKYVALAEMGNPVSIELLVDFPWQMLTRRRLEDRRVKFSGFKADSGDWHRPMMVEKPLQPKENFRAVSRDAFFHFGERALEAMRDTPLQNASMVVAGFGEERASRKPSNLTVRIASEYDVHTLPYDPEARKKFNRDLNALVVLAEDGSSYNPVHTALEEIDKQEDGGNLEFIPFPYPAAIQLQSNLMSCSLSEIYLTLDRVVRQQGEGVLYVASYNADNRAHTSRFGPETPYARVIEPALESLLSDRLDKPVHVRSDFY